MKGESLIDDVRAFYGWYNLENASKHAVLLLAKELEEIKRVLKDKPPKNPNQLEFDFEKNK